MKEKKPAFILPIIIAIVLSLMYFVVIPSMMAPQVKEISYSEFKTMLKEDKVAEVEFGPYYIEIIPVAQEDSYAKVTYRTGRLYDVEHTTLMEELEASGVKYGSPIQKDNTFTQVLMYIILPTLLTGAIMILIMRNMSKKMGGGVMSFGKNTSKLYAEKSTGKTFLDVAGQDEAKVALKEIIDFLNYPAKYTSIGAKLPKGALLVGPPGTGKTLMAKAVAGEAHVPFFSLSGSEFVEMFVGMGAARVRDLFKQAVSNAPCIVFIDEIDAIGKSRDNTLGGNDEREQTLNQLLSEMDGFDSSKGVVILAATNRPEVLDKALLRPGRFDRRITVDLPDLEGRVAILNVHARHVIMDTEVDLDVIARQTPGASGADLENIINEAALRAVRKNKNKVFQTDLEEAVEVILAGEERKNKVLSDKEKNIVAYHEIGHALVAARLSNTEPVHKITIIPRTSGALGYTMQVAKEEKNLMSKEEALEHICVLAGGRAAEELVFNSITTGAANDIERATQIARLMVTQYGMSNEFGFVNLEKKTNMFLSDNVTGSYSDATAARIDAEIMKIISDCYSRTMNLLKENRKELDALAAKLYEKENITGQEFMNLLAEADQSSTSSPTVTS
ncbi:MAG: ATP-dependent zinc metalloprotease FtsH [Ruminococcaceae bacterium]|nr:ATP-dependent zinc metalloprotease FtsH [Oscillospiraceae bacterium]